MAIAILRTVYEVVNILEQIVKGKVILLVISTLQDSKNFKSNRNKSSKSPGKATKGKNVTIALIMMTMQIFLVTDLVKRFMYSCMKYMAQNRLNVLSSRNKAIANDKDRLTNTINLSILMLFMKIP
jgi:hypothetical protein